MVTRNCRVVNKFVSVVLNEVKRTTRNKQFCCSQKFFFTIVSLICANQNICGLAQSLVVVKEKIIKRTTWQWQEQVSCNRRTIIILHIRKKIISVLLWQDHCVIVCCTTHARAHIVEEDWFFYLILINYPATKLSNVSICFIKVF